MAIIPEGTPNPNAVKFTVGRPVGGPTTLTRARPTDDPLGTAILAVDGVTSVFLTADFVTISKTPDADWAEIVPVVVDILESHFG